MVDLLGWRVTHINNDDRRDGASPCRAFVILAFVNLAALVRRAMQMLSVKTKQAKRFPLSWLALHRFTLCFFAIGVFAGTETQGAPATTADQVTHNDPRLAAIDAIVADGRKELMLDPVAALANANRARDIATRLPASRARDVLYAKTSWLKGAAFVSGNRAPEAVPVLRDALNSAIKLTDQPKLLGDLNMALANAQLVLGSTEQALYGLQQAHRYYRSAGEGRSEAIVLQNIGTIYSVARDYDQALRYYDQAASAYRGDAITEIALLVNRGVVLKAQGKAQAAVADFARGADLARTAHSPAAEAMALGNLASAQLLAGDTNGADHSIARGFALGDDANISAKSPLLYGVAAEAALRRGHPTEARTLIQKALASAGAANSKVLQREFEQTAYQIYKALGDESRSLAHLEQFKRLDDQARAVAASTSAALMSARFYSANQNTLIAQLGRNKAEQEATIQRNQVLFQRRLLAGAAFIVMLLLIGYFLIRRSRNQVRAANDELTGTNAELERALAARTEFLATTSHEIRTPLNGILGMTQVLLADRTLEAGIKGKIELVQGAGETMKALVDDILDVAKISNGELTIHRDEMGLQKLLREAGQVWEAQANTKGVAIDLDMAGAPERIIEDEVRLRQIVFNLMANAVKFTDRGAVRLRAWFVPDSDAIPDGLGTLRIAISDTGIGIPSDRLEDIFESFRQIDGGTTRRHGGTGLGLAICRNLARAMGGDVDVTSVLGGGSTFTIELPCTPVARPAARRAPASLAETRLLLIESNPLARSIQTAVLGPHVDRIVPAGELTEAREALSEERVDFALADAGVFGGDIAQAADFARLATDHGVPLVLLWPSPDETVRAKATAAGILRIIAKPIAAQEMVAVLKDIYMTECSRQEIAA